MVSEHQYNKMKVWIPQIKHLFQTRHYLQCKSLCEEHLQGARTQIHPMHRAYLHFYLAMSHDSMAREATLKHRHRELELAEQHYIAALAALTPPIAGRLGDIDESSPTSTASDEVPNWTVRRGSDASSFHSDQSMASSTTFVERDANATDWETAPLRFSSKHSTPSQSSYGEDNVGRILSNNPLAPIITTNHQEAYHQFFIDLVSFISLVQQHLANVCKLRENAMVRTVRFDTPSPQLSTVRSRPVSSDGSYLNETDMAKRRRYRKSITFRPRFDPTSVQRLCAEAIAEL